MNRQPTDRNDEHAPDIDADASAVVEPEKLIRMAWVAGALLRELRTSPLDDERGVERLRATLFRLLVELASAVSEETARELARLVEMSGGARASEAELQVLEAQIVGWVDGLLAALAFNEEVTETSDDKEVAHVVVRARRPASALGRQRALVERDPTPARTA
jgi:hypothetical protein